MNIRSIFKNQNLLSILLIFLCFTLTSGGWISWNYNLMNHFSSVTADLLSMAAGYTLQAAGIGLFYLIKKKLHISPAVFSSVLVLFILLLFPSINTDIPAAAVIFGLLLNLICGVIAGTYLDVLAFKTSKKRRGVVFGLGYAASTIAVWLISMIGGGSFLNSPYIIIVYVCIAFLSAYTFFIVSNNEITANQGPVKDKLDINNSPVKNLNPLELKKLILLGCAVCLLLSIVKNLGFSFPNSDIQAGLNMELSRIFYGVGLLISGLINDKTRRYGAICALAALVLPFISLALSGQSVSGIFFWALDYFFYGFFSVFRILLFADLAEDTGLIWLSGMGLLVGRIGDSLGEVLCIRLSANAILLISVTSVLFIITIVLFFQLYIKLFLVAGTSVASQAERFVRFSDNYALSTREQDVIKLLLDGRSNSEIAAELFVSESTVKFHIHNILKKTGCKNRIELRSAFVNLVPHSTES